MGGEWSRAVDELTALLHQARTPEGAEYLDRFADDLARRLRRPSGEEAGMVRNMVEAGVRELPRAVPTWVSAEVVDLVTAAAETFEPEAVYADDIAPVPAAFCLLEKPLRLAGSDDNRFRAIHWTPAAVTESDDDPSERPGCLFSLYVHVDDLGTWRPVGGSPLTLAYSTCIMFGDPPPADDERTSAARELRCQLQVLWRLARQEIVKPRREPTHRAAFRRAGKAPKMRDVTVLTLRRERQRHDRDGEGRAVDWSHRWAVSGHWRKQWYPSLGDHRQIWIAPYVKGPDDRPFVAKRLVVDFRR